MEDKDVELLDQMVAEGVAASRADAVRRLIARERRRQRAEHDADIYAREGPDRDLHALAVWAASRRVNID